MEESTQKKSIIQMCIENVHRKAALNNYHLENLKTDESFNKNVSKLSEFFNLPETEAIIFASCFNYYFLKIPPLAPFNFLDVLLVVSTYILHRYFQNHQMHLYLQLLY